MELVSGLHGEDITTEVVSHLTNQARLSLMFIVIRGVLLGFPEVSRVVLAEVVVVDEVDDRILLKCAGSVGHWRSQCPSVDVELHLAGACKVLFSDGVKTVLAVAATFMVCW
eukprot:TRINITY_DN85008_c0_g1_i2.p1 TRINITY_DN85008_c0_g1~~TRINITY_DN85008_c0_g1_i2.p1  ORF type:complete len:112 (-),score=19.68 TRINITY_DN85008_c0_g1_i2:115-450(-)